MAQAPVANGCNHRNEALALAGQAILDPGRHHAKILAVDQPRFSQRLQLAAEHARRDLRTALKAAQQTIPDFTVAQWTILEIPDDPQLVLAADHLLKRGDRTAARQRRSRFRHPAILRHGPARNHDRCKPAKVHTIIFVHTCAAARKGTRLAAATQGKRKGATMKHFMIKYQFANGTTEE